MKKMILFGLVLTAASSAFAQTTPVQIFCLKMTGNEELLNKPLGSAQCTVTQSMSNSDLSSIWTCSFNGEASQTLQTIATYINDPAADGSVKVDYDIFAQEDLGSFLLKGMNMSVATWEGTPLFVNLGAKPSIVYNQAMLENSTTGAWLDLNFNSITNGSCE